LVQAGKYRTEDKWKYRNTQTKHKPEKNNAKQQNKTTWFGRFLRHSARIWDVLNKTTLTNRHGAKQVEEPSVGGLEYFVRQRSSGEWCSDDDGRRWHHSACCWGRVETRWHGNAISDQFSVGCICSTGHVPWSRSAERCERQLSAWRVPA